MIDSHAHLDSPRYDEDRDALLARAWEAGVRTILSIGIGDGPDTMHQALDLARRYASQPGIPKIFASAGVHPHEAQLAGEAAYAKLDDPQTLNLYQYMRNNPLGGTDPGCARSTAARDGLPERSPPTPTRMPGQRRR